MKKSGLADSPFFPSTPPQPQVSSPLAPETSDPFQSEKPGNHPSATVVSRYQSPYQDTLIEEIRKAVKEFGKEAATHRFTLTEKRAIASIVHTLQMQGIRTTENEITRIAINFLITEFQQHGKDSLLGRVLQALKR
jgi:hypothetical protein